MCVCLLFLVRVVLKNFIHFHCKMVCLILLILISNNISIIVSKIFSFEDYQSDFMFRLQPDLCFVGRKQQKIFVSFQTKKISIQVQSKSRVKLQLRQNQTTILEDNEEQYCDLAVFFYRNINCASLKIDNFILLLFFKLVFLNAMSQEPPDKPLSPDIIVNNINSGGFFLLVCENLSVQFQYH